MKWTFRITGPGVNVDERSERAILIRLRFFRVFGDPVPEDTSTQDSPDFTEILIRH